MATIYFIEKYLSIRDLGQHSHKYWELIFVISGNGKFEFFDHPSIEYKKGDVICIPPSISHQNFPSPAFKNINITLINWTPKFNKPILISTPQYAEIDYTNDLYYIFNLTFKYYHSIYKNQDIINNLTNVLLSFCESCIKHPDCSATSQVIESKIIQNYMYANFSLEDIYSELNYSKRYLQRLFIKDYGISPSRFLNMQRLNAAIKYLDQTIENDYSVSEISNTCGFLDQYYFSRVFKKEFGLSPTEYKAIKKIPNPPPNN